MAEIYIGDGIVRNAQADADMNIAIYGADTVILGNVDNAMKASIYDNNTVRISAGMAMKDGRPIQIRRGTTEDFHIPNGQQGVTTVYYLGYKIRAGEDGNTIDAVVSTTRTTAGSMHNGDTEMYAWLYSATVNGVVLESVTALCNTVKMTTGVISASGTVVAKVQNSGNVEPETPETPESGGGGGTTTTEPTGVKWKATTGVNMRTGAGTSYSVVTTLSKDEILYVDKESNGWKHGTVVRSGKWITGWVAGNLLAKV